MPEVWRFDGERLAVFELVEGVYVERAASIAFPSLAIADITTLLKECETTSRPEWIRRVRLWAHTQK